MKMFFVKNHGTPKQLHKNELSLGRGYLTTTDHIKTSCRFIQKHAAAATQSDGNG
jgi:hypothetical protein